jgi:hypothetical protein
MPIKYSSKYNSNDAIWTYTHDEDIKIGNFCYITRLIITTDTTINTPKLILSSLYGFIYLRELTIINIPVIKLTDVGHANLVRIQNTHLRSIEYIDMRNVNTLILYKNPKIDVFQIPKNVVEFTAVDQEFRELYTSSIVLRNIKLYICKFKYIYKLGDAVNLEELDIKEGEHNYSKLKNNYIINMARKKEIIKKHNIESKYVEYGQFQEIKERIKLTERNMESPITQVFWLGSNYARRMSEYCVDVSCV